jgi:glycosyltransferase involved in cell wall biosynthesis
MNGIDYKNINNTIKIKKENEIIEVWNRKYDKPIVSILCLVYNHEKYVEDAIRGFLLQVTEYPYEVLIHDDASDDGSVEIIKKYEKEYPNIIKPIYQKENQWSKNDALIRNMQYGRAKGKYIAYCDGDDCWVDPKKLQIQIDYLESHPQIAISSHDAVVVDENYKLIKKSKLPDTCKRDLTSEEVIMIKGWMLTVSMVCRNVEIMGIPEMNKVFNVDTFITSLVGNNGGSHYHTDIKKAVYREHSNGIWSNKSDIEKDEITSLTWFWLYRYYKRIGKYDYSEIFRRRYRTLMLKMFSEKDLIKEVYKRFKDRKKITK